MKAYIIYIPWQWTIEISKDVTFAEDVFLWKSKESHLDINDEEQEATKDVGSRLVDQGFVDHP